MANNENHAGATALVRALEKLIDAKFDRRTEKTTTNNIVAVELAKDELISLFSREMRDEEKN